ncbi:sensor histidine kinase [Phenylobacterium sp.]|uniref:sensor histidine kinase n=1 Tax=Phenylobacterium sp. TaxID=1871053 RepID=UPI002ED81D80
MSADQIVGPAGRDAAPGSGVRLTDPLIVAAAVLATALLGIAMRPVGLLSAFWPANAVLLGLFLRAPRLATPFGWSAAALAYVAADLITGGTWIRTLLLTGANLAGVVVGFVLLSRLHADDLALKRPTSVISVTLGAAVASVAVGLVGAASHPLLFHGAPSFGVFFFWAATELANYMIVLPVILTAPDRFTPGAWLERLRRTRPGEVAPVVVYFVVLALTPVLGASGALAFPVPALLWCALVYGRAGAAWLNLSFAVWVVLVVSANPTTFGLALDTPAERLSLRLGVMLVALGPIMVASVMAARDALLREATLARKSAEDAMAARSLLLATMTHELRSPLTSVVGFSNLMVKQSFGPLGNPKYVDYAQSIELAGSHLSDLVTDLLDTAKLEAGRLELASARISSGDVVDQALRLVRGLALESGVTVSTGAGPWPEIWADPRAVKQVLINLVSNGIKFSRPDSAVTVTGEIVGERLFIHVVDQGQGIAPSDLPLVGRAYAQAGDAQSRRQGTGLGLTLSSELVRQHGGKLVIDSTVGVGTRVTFDLPLSPG